MFRTVNSSHILYKSIVMIVTSTEQKYQAGRLSQTEVGKIDYQMSVGLTYGVTMECMMTPWVTVN